MKILILVIIGIAAYFAYTKYQESHSTTPTIKQQAQGFAPGPDTPAVLPGAQSPGFTNSIKLQGVKKYN